MSVAIRGYPTNYAVKYETAQTLELLEKCGEVFLERQQGSLIYLCTLCDDKFQDVELFSNHISVVHLSVESFITYEPNESDVDDEERTTEVLNVCKEESINLGQHQAIPDGSLINNEKIFNIIDSTKYRQDIEVYVDESELDPEIKEEPEEIIIADTPMVTSIFIPESQSPIIVDETRDPVDVLRLENPNQIEETEVESENVVLDDVPEVSDVDILRSKLKCKFCDDQFDYVKQLRQHDCGVRKRTRFYDCSVCGKLFKKKSGLDIHMLIHKGEKPHKCDICGSAYACKQNLIVHIRRHTGEKPFQCDFCDRSFASSTEKISHTRTHTGERPFVCELCGKAHTSSSQLNEHMFRHLDIRNYPCDTCDKRFRNSYNLRMHKLTHGNAPRQFSCPHCLSSFKTMNNLRQHIKIHQAVKKYVCKICGKSFAQHPGLYSHMKSHAISK